MCIDSVAVLYTIIMLNINVQCQYIIAIHIIMCISRKNYLIHNTNMQYQIYLKRKKVDNMGTKPLKVQIYDFIKEFKSVPTSMLLVFFGKIKNEDGIKYILHGLKNNSLIREYDNNNVKGVINAIVLYVGSSDSGLNSWHQYQTILTDARPMGTYITIERRTKK